MTFLYSPYPMVRYRLAGLEADEITVIDGSGVAAPLWNLFWLSNPDLDKVPELRDLWWRGYRPNATLLSSLIKDSYNDAVLCEMAVSHPMRFSVWFEAQVHRDYYTYENHGGSSWVSTVLRRAEEVSNRLLMKQPLVMFAGGKLRIT